MKFAEIVRSSLPVRESFRDLPVHHAWWRLILALHGKPIDIDADSHEASITLAKGFRFYGILYISLAFTMAAVIPVILATSVPNPGYWVVLLLGSSCYLGLASHLALSGSANYTSSHRNARAHLIVFFVAVIAYLACFCGVVLAITHYTFPQYDCLTVTGLLLFMLGGIASYLIEILFLVFQVGPQEPE